MNEQTSSSPGQVAFSAFAQQHINWANTFDATGKRALARDYHFTSAEVASRFAAEVIYRKHKARVGGSMMMENLRIRVVFSDPDDDDSGGSVIALAQSCDSLYGDCQYPDS